MRFVKAAAAAVWGLLIFVMTHHYQYDIILSNYIGRFVPLLEKTAVLPQINPVQLLLMMYSQLIRVPRIKARQFRPSFTEMLTPSFTRSSNQPAYTMAS